MTALRSGTSVEIIEGACRVVATSTLSDVSPDAAAPWQARVDVYRNQESIPSFSMALADWHANSKTAQTVALNYGIYAARLLPFHAPI